VENWFLGAGIALCLFSLWAISRHDWLRLIRPIRRAVGEVCNHRISHDADGVSYAAIYRFTAEDGEHEVIDAVYSVAAKPPIGTRIELTYPAGRPDLARPPRPLLWSGVYLLLFGMLGILAAKALGWLDG
jgi:hypothetical protein